MNQAHSPIRAALSHLYPNSTYPSCLHEPDLIDPSNRSAHWYGLLPSTLISHDVQRQEMHPEAQTQGRTANRMGHGAHPISAAQVAVARAAEEEATDPVTDRPPSRYNEVWRGVGYATGSQESRRWYVKRMYWTEVDHQWFGHWEWVRYPNRPTWPREREAQFKQLAWLDGTILDRAIATAAGACLPEEMLVHVARCARETQTEESLVFKRGYPFLLRSISMVCREWRRSCFPAAVEKLYLTLDATTFLAFTQFLETLGSTNFRPHVKELLLVFKPAGHHFQSANLGQIFANLGRLLGSTLVCLEIRTQGGISRFWDFQRRALYRAFTTLSSLTLNEVRLFSSTDLLRVLACLTSLKDARLDNVTCCDLQRRVVPRSRMRKHHMEFRLSDRNPFANSPGREPIGIAAALPLCWTWSVSQGAENEPLLGIVSTDARTVSSILRYLVYGDVVMSIEPTGQSSCMSCMCIFRRCQTDYPCRCRLYRMLF